MNSNVIFKLFKDTIVVSQLKKEPESTSLNNTNVIDIKELKFSTEYIKDNFELVANFLNVVIIKNNIVNVQINNMEIATQAMDLVNQWEHITNVIFKPDKEITMDLFLKILDNKYILSLECYDIATYLMERLDVNKKLIVNTRNKMHTLSEFMKNNKLVSYSDIYYKRQLVFDKEVDKNELIDLKLFMGINVKLKVIKIKNYSNALLTSILNELQANKKHDISIEIEEKGNDLSVIYNSIGFIKKSYKDYLDKYYITFKLNYSKEYKKNNIAKEINFKFFKYIISLIVIVAVLTLSINYYKQYKDQEKIDSQLYDITSIMNDAEEANNVDDNDTDIEFIEAGDTPTTTKSNWVASYYTNFSKAFEKLKSINKDTVGWLSVPGTKIDYPITQSTTNSYYLNRDFYQIKNSMGWTFMDYRNDPVGMSQNTIIYGHNIKSGIMFGTLKYALNSSWYTNPNNQIITYNSLTTNMRWKIFSIYKIPETDDYLTTDFANNEEFMTFVDLIKGRSIHNFGVDIKSTDKILTLSTCNNHVNRTVVHAVLITDEA